MLEDEKKHKARASRLLKVYGITIDEWEDKLKEQNGVCFICQKFPKNGILCTDHIHVKGYEKFPPEEKKKYVRGLLCFMCNTALKCVEKTSDGTRNRKMLDGMVEYFLKYKIKGE